MFSKSCMNKNHFLTVSAKTFCIIMLAVATNMKTQAMMPFSAPVDSSKVYDIEEIVVVSQPKENLRLREQAVGSTSFSMKDFYSLNSHDIRELSAFVPSFSMPQYGSRYTSSMYIRGIGSRINNPAVGIYIDNVPLMCKSAYNFHIYELDRMDVLRGPQGTLYGQNTEGGLVRVYTKNPVQHQGTDINLSAGSHFYRNVEAAHYARPTNHVAFSVAAFYGGHDGFFRNTHLNTRADKSDEGGIRMRTVIDPADRLHLDLLADYQVSSQNAFPYGQLNPDNGQTELPATTMQNHYRRHSLCTALGIQLKGERFDISSTTSYQYLSDNMLMDIDYLPSAYMYMQQRQWENAITQELTMKSRNNGMWNHTTGLFLSQQWLKTNAPVNFGQDMTTPIATGIQTAMTQAIVRSMAESMMAQGMTEQQALAAAAMALERAGGIEVEVGMDVPGCFHTPQFNLGLFHESTFNLTPRLTLTAGLRYDMNHTRISYDTYATMDIAAYVMGKTSENVLTSRLFHKTRDTYNQLLPKLAFTLKTDNKGSNVFMSVSKGYRAGGFNIQMFSDILQTELNANRQQAMRGSYDIPHEEADYQHIEETIAYKPETSWNLEAGAHLNLANGSLKLDCSAYHMQVRNLQLSVMAGNYAFGRMMVNAGRSATTGMELALRGSVLNDRLTWNLGYALTEATFRSYKDMTVNDSGQQCVDYRGKHVPFVPIHTLNAHAAYRADINAGLLDCLTFGINLTADGKTYWDEANSYSQPFHAVAGVNVSAGSGPHTLSLWAKNITSCKYNTFAMSSGATGETRYFAQRGNPFQMGVDLRLRF